MTNDEVFDTAVIAEIRNAIGEERLAVVFAVMARTARREADLVTRYIEGGNFDEARRVAHGIAGGALSLGAALLGKTARHIEISNTPMQEDAAALVDAVDATLRAIPRIVGDPA